MFIADVAFKKEQEYKRIGSIWYSEKQHRCSILLSGFRFGLLFAKPHVENPPYIKGDINISLGKKNKFTEYLWLGWMWTDTNQEGSVYQMVLEVDPSPSYRKETRGYWLNVKLEDKE